MFKKAVPMLEVMGKAHFFLGEVGKGAEMKLVVNMVRTRRCAGGCVGITCGRGGCRCIAYVALCGNYCRGR